MENKKLLKYLLKDLSELEEMFTESGKNSFDDMEMEFIQNRVSGAKRLVQLFFEHENEVHAEVKSDSTPHPKTDLQKADVAKVRPEIVIEERIQKIKPEGKATGIWVEEIVPGVVVLESMPEIETEEKTQEIVIEEEIHETSVEEKLQAVEHKFTESEINKEPGIEIQEKSVDEVPKQAAKLRPAAIQQELRLDDEESVDIHNKRLGDLFSKEKSVNDSMSFDSSKLEHKLSNRPVDSLQSAIGINDRFQYIRELFEGSADNFVKTVADLDSMEDIKDAVDYLQTNFKWKKNETSLKFVNLIKRRFPNE